MMWPCLPGRRGLHSLTVGSSQVHPNPGQLRYFISLSLCGDLSLNALSQGKFLSILCRSVVLVNSTHTTSKNEEQVCALGDAYM